MDIWSPQAVGVIGQALCSVVYFFFWRVKCYLENKLHCEALTGSYERAGILPLNTLVSCIIMFSEFWAFPALKDLHEGTWHREVLLAFLWHRVHRAIKISFPLPPDTSRPLCWHCHFSLRGLWAALSLMRLRCPLEGFARSDWSLVKDGACTLGSVVKSDSIGSLSLTYLPPRTKCWPKANTRFQKKMLIWGQKEKSPSTVPSSVILPSCGKLFDRVKSLTVHCESCIHRAEEYHVGKRKS